ncbi:MAG TPA: MFS transporter [Feifaniaceae bacterium]|nr:MFS transporter [Feifaniaceae bacterium]
MAKEPGKLKMKLAYAAGDIYGGGSFLIFSMLFMNFLVLVEGLPVVATSLIVFIGKLWDAITDPIMGRISDRTRSRYGRRRLYFLIGIIPVFASFVMMFYSFGMVSTLSKIIYYTFAYMFFGTAFTIVMVPYNAILSDMTSDYNERTSFTTVRMLFSGGASLIAAIVPGTLIKLFGGSVNGPAQKPGYLVMATVMAAIFGLCWLFAFLGTREKENLPPPEKITMRDWLSPFANKAYRNYLGIFLSFQVAVDLVLALFIFYIDIVVLKYTSYTLVMGVLLVFSLVFMALMGAVAQKKGKAFPLYIGMPVWILTMFGFLFANSSTSVYILCALAAFIAVGSASGNLSTWSMLTDIFDIDEIRTAKRREGIYSGLTTFLRKFASGVAILVLGFGLKALGFDQNQYNLLKASGADFDPTVYAQSSLVSGIKWMFVLIPVVLLSITLFFAIKNKVNKRRFDAVLKGIDSFQQIGSLAELSEQEKEDVCLVTGETEDKLWGKKA